jgi:hypothetical protein
VKTKPSRSFNRINEGMTPPKSAARTCRGHQDGVHFLLLHFPSDHFGRTDLCDGITDNAKDLGIAVQKIQLVYSSL